MSENIEAELKLLVSQISERATQGGGMDRETYETMTAASVALSTPVHGGERQGHGNALLAAQARLRACAAETYVRAA